MCLFTVAPPLHARPQALVVLADGLTLDDVTRPDLPGLARLRASGALALMSPGLAQRPDPVANVYATLGAGDSVRVGDVSQGRLGETLRRAHVQTALIGQDIGPSSPARLILPAPTIAAETADPASLWAATRAAFRTCDLVLVRFVGGQSALPRLDVFLTLARSGPQAALFLVVPTPPQRADGSWDRLTPFYTFNLQPEPKDEKDSSSYPAAESPTTQTWGLVAARDFAPTVLAALQIAPPIQMTGAAVVPSSVSDSGGVLPRLRRMDRQVRLNQEAQIPVFWTVGVGASAVVFSTLGLLLAGRMAGPLGAASRYGLRLIASWPLALLLAPLAGPPSARAYLAVILGATFGLALLPSPTLIFGLTALVLVGDGLSGTSLVSDSALSEYALSGIRFYGIGNEYMGVLIGGALLACLVPWERRRGRAGGRGDPAPTGRDVGAGSPRPLLPAHPQNWGGGAALALWFALVTFTLSFPAFGAKAGGAVTATATFVAAWRLLRGRPVSWWWAVGGVAAGFGLVFVWAALGHVLPLRRTHLDTAAEALGQGRLGYIAGVALRKIGLAARVGLHPGTLLGLAAFAGMGWVLRRLLWGRVQSYLAARPRETAIYHAGLWGCLVAVLFNDSGIVAAILILQCLALTLLHGLYGQAGGGQDASAGA